MTGHDNRRLQTAKNNSADEFYTQLSDIEKELKYYSKLFQNKSVLCNCDDPKESNFFKYFSLNFERLQLKKLTAVCYKNINEDLFSRNTDIDSVYLEYFGDQNKNNVPDNEEIKIKNLRGDGDFRSAEGINLLKEADFVVTNPPFSLFRDYMKLLVEHKKKFLIIGNMNALTYKEIFPLFQKNKIWFGPSISSGDREFGVPDNYPLDASGTRIDDNGKKFIRVKGVRWFTNLEYKGRKRDLILYKKYSSEEYPKYDNFDAIEVSKTADIPCDYNGPMGVPITFMDKYNPDQFEILGNLGSYAPDGYSLISKIFINGKKKYKRILIKKVLNEN
tara:strand:+ start:716 stop:1711 length:996 start_codon:yes stop_codon:yes gene_type:complete